jgi:hypothetical protein
MKLKSLLFGSAAVLAAGTGAQAADLPTVEPVEYVRICDAFGTGFYYIPGTDTCLRISGRVRVESHYVDGSEEALEEFFDAGDDGEDFNNWTTRARGNVRLDARTQTDFGLIRAFIEFQLTVGPQATSETDGGDDEPNYDTANPDLSAAFIQISNDWGTYTAGHTGSFFDFWGSYGFGTRLNIDDNTTEQTLFAWTFAGGNGFSFTLSAEDPASSGRRLNGEDSYEGQEFPDGVANIRIDQGWGSAQIMGVIHHVNDIPDDEDDIGWAAGAGLRLGIPAGWELSAQGGISEGALGYITTDPFGIGDINDDDDLNEAWMVRAGITGPFLMPNVSVWADGSFTHVEEADVDEYDFWAFKVGGQWEPAPGLIMGPEFAYNAVDADGDDGGDEFEEDVWGVMWRIQRDF